MSGRNPNPIADYNTAALDVREKLILEYGEGTVQWAEMATVIQILFYTGIIKPNEFIDLVTKQCARTDDRRRRAAGFTD